MSHGPIARLAVVGAVVLGSSLGACGEGHEERRVDVGSGQPITVPLPAAPVGISAAERLGVRPNPEDGPKASALDWTAPGAWRELPAAPMREVGFRVGDDPDAGCTLAVFPGTTGGVLEIGRASCRERVCMLV